MAAAAAASPSGVSSNQDAAATGSGVAALYRDACDSATPSFTAAPRGGDVAPTTQLGWNCASAALTDWEVSYDLDERAWRAESSEDNPYRNGGVVHRRITSIPLGAGVAWPNVDLTSSATPPWLSPSRPSFEVALWTVLSTAGEFVPVLDGTSMRVYTRGGDRVYVADDVYSAVAEGLTAIPGHTGRVARFSVVAALIASGRGAMLEIVRVGNDDWRATFAWNCATFGAHTIYYYDRALRLLRPAIVDGSWTNPRSPPGPVATVSASAGPAAHVMDLSDEHAQINRDIEILVGDGPLWSVLAANLQPDAPADALPATDLTRYGVEPNPGPVSGRRTKFAAGKDPRGKDPRVVAKKSVQFRPSPPPGKIWPLSDEESRDMRQRQLQHLFQVCMRILSAPEGKHLAGDLAKCRKSLIDMGLTDAMIDAEVAGRRADALPRALRSVAPAATQEQRDAAIAVLSAPANVHTTEERSRAKIALITAGLSIGDINDAVGEARSMQAIRRLTSGPSPAPTGPPSASDYLADDPSSAPAADDERVAAEVDRALAASSALVPLPAEDPAVLGGVPARGRHPPLARAAVVPSSSKDEAPREFVADDSAIYDAINANRARSSTAILAAAPAEAAAQDLAAKAAVDEGDQQGAEFRPVDARQLVLSNASAPHRRPTVFKAYDVPDLFDLASAHPDWFGEGDLIPFERARKQVFLVEQLVDDVAAHVFRDHGVTYELAKLKCGALMSTLLLSSQEKHHNLMYASAIGYILGRERSRVAEKFVARSYFSQARCRAILALFLAVSILLCSGAAAFSVRNFDATLPAAETETLWMPLISGRSRVARAMAWYETAANTVTDPIGALDATLRGEFEWIPPRAHGVLLVREEVSVRSCYDQSRGPAGYLWNLTPAVWTRCRRPTVVSVFLDHGPLAASRAWDKQDDSWTVPIDLVGPQPVERFADFIAAYILIVGAVLAAFTAAGVAVADIALSARVARPVLEEMSKTVIGGIFGQSGVVLFAVAECQWRARAAVPGLRTLFGCAVSVIPTLAAWWFAETGFSFVGLGVAAACLPFCWLACCTADASLFSFSRPGSAVDAFRRGLLHQVLWRLNFAVACILHVGHNFAVRESARLDIGAPRPYRPKRDGSIRGSVAKFVDEGYTAYLTDSINIECGTRENGWYSEPDPSRDNVKRGPRDACKPRYVGLGFRTEGCVPTVFESNYINERSAIRKRVVGESPVIDDAFVAEYIEFMKENHDRIFPGCSNIEAKSFERWIAECNSSASAKAQFRKAYEQDQRDGIHPGSSLSREELYHATAREAFVKVETNNYSTPEGTKQKAPRLIQGATARFVARLGPWFAAAQGRVKSAWDGRKTCFLFTSGRSATRVAEFIGELVSKGWLILEDDIGAYDASICEALCYYELWWAIKCGAPRIVIDHMRANIATHGSTSRGLKYGVDGTRKSGDPFTSLFNSIHNGGMKLFLYCKLRGVSVEQAMEEIGMVVQGDDNLMCHAAQEDLNFAPHMLRLGFESECIYREKLENAEFCSCRFCRSLKGWRLVPKAGRQFSKMGYFINPPNASAESLMRGVALGFAASCSLVPPLRAVCDRILELTSGVEAHPPKRGDWQMWWDRDEPDALSNADFYTVYHWSAATQKLFEAELATMQLGDVSNHWTFKLLCDLDTSGPSAYQELNAHMHTFRPRRAATAGVLPAVLVGVFVALAATAAPGSLISATASPCLQSDSYVDGESPRKVVEVGRWAERSLNQSHVGPGRAETGLFPAEPSRAGRAVKLRGAKTITFSWPTTVGPHHCPHQRARKDTHPKMSGILKHNKHNKRPATGKKHKSKSLKKALKVVAGHGDYRPTQFQRVRGRGDYFGDVLGKAGSFLGTKVGNFLQGGFRKLTGFGDYRSSGPKSNSLYSHPKRNAEGPDESSFAMGSCAIKFGGKAPRVQHREYIGPVLSTGSGFNTKVYRIQPGLQGVDVLFPWGSSVAGCFQQYVLHGAIFEFVSTSSEFASGSALGAVMMSTLYDAEATPLASVIEVDNNEYTTTAKPSVSFYHPIECASRDNPTTVRYVRKSNTPASGTDERLDDVGIFQLSTNGIAAAAGTQIGELWVTYDIEFLKSALPDVHVGTSAAFTYTTQNSRPATSSPGAWTPNPMNSLPATLGDAADPVGIRIKLPVSYNGNFLIVGHFVAISVPFNGGVAFQVDTGSDVTMPVKLFRDNTLSGRASLASSSSTTSCMVSMVVSTIAQTASQNYVDIAVADGVWSPAYASIVVTALDNDLSDPRSVLAARAKRGDVGALAQLLEMSGVHDAPSAAASSSSPSSLPPPRPRRLSASSYEDERFVDGPDTPKPLAGTDLEQSVYLPKGVLAEMLARARG